MIVLQSIISFNAMHTSIITVSDISIELPITTIKISYNNLEIE
jgi:hypothetical protein